MVPARVPNWRHRETIRTASTALGLTLVTPARLAAHCDALDGPAQPYFAYLYQARVDRLGGLFGRLLRRVVEREIKARAGDTLVGLRDRLDSGDPPVTDTDVSR